MPPQARIRWHQRVKSRVSFAVLVSIIVPLVAFYSIIAVLSTRAQSREAEDDLSVIVGDAGVTVSNFIASVAFTLRVSSNDIDPASLSHRDLDLYLSALAHEQPEVDAVAYVTDEGREVERISLFQVYFQNQLRDLSGSPALAAVKKNRIFHGRPFVDSEGKPFMQVAVPVYGPRLEVTGMLLADVRLRKIFELVERSWRGSERLYIVDSQGTVIAHSDYSLVLRRLNLRNSPIVSKTLATPAGQTTGVLRYRDYEGHKVLGLGMSNRDLGWGMIAEVNENELHALGGIRRLNEYFALIFLSAAFLGGIGSLLIGSKAAQTIQRMQVATQAIGEGDFKRRVELRSQGELGQLEHDLNFMAAKLEEYYHHLERDVEVLNQMVYERTKSLQSAYDELQERDRVLKEAQSALVQTEKLASLGGLIAGVVHEVNNPLAYVLNNVEVLRRDVLSLSEMLKVCQAAAATRERRQRDDLMAQAADLAESVELDNTLPAIERLFASTSEGLQRIRKIVTDLREFSHTGEAAKEPADLNEIVRTTLGILSYEVKKRRVDLQASFSDLPMIVCSPVKISQVVLNIVMNALQAVREEGHVWVETSRDESNAMISIRDDGHGIPQGIIDKIFDPFFTTRPRGEGTGLGLSVSYGIVREHNGSIEVESEAGRGTKFTVKLPFKPEKQQ